MREAKSKEINKNRIYSTSNGVNHEIPRRGLEHMLGLRIFIFKSSPTYSRCGVGQRALSFMSATFPCALLSPLQLIISIFFLSVLGMEVR